MTNGKYNTNFIFRELNSEVLSIVEAINGGSFDAQEVAVSHGAMWPLVARSVEWGVVPAESREAIIRDRIAIFAPKALSIDPSGGVLADALIMSQVRELWGPLSEAAGVVSPSTNEAWAKVSEIYRAWSDA